MRPIRTTPEERAAAKVSEGVRQRSERARDTLDASLRAAGVEGFASAVVLKADAAGAGWRVSISFDSATDAYLAATRLAFLREARSGSLADHVALHNAFDRGRRVGRTEACYEPVAGEGEPEHYEAVDAAAPMPGSAWANRAPAWPPPAERRLPAGPEGKAYRRGW